MGIWARRTTVEYGCDSRKVSRYPPRYRLSCVSGSRRKANAVPVAECREEHWDQTDRIIRDASRCECQRALFFASTGKIFRYRSDRARPSDRLRNATRRTAHRSRKTARIEFRIQVIAARIPGTQTASPPRNG